MDGTDDLKIKMQWDPRAAVRVTGYLQCSFRTLEGRVL